nr:hypothetical protein [uncultured Albidiferax sp.]
MRPRVYNPNTTHSDSYYHSVLKQLIAGTNENLTYQQMADGLNAQDIKTSGGLSWSAENVKGVLRKLRLHREMPSKIHHALLHLVFNQELSLKETLPLFKTRSHGMM